jgi:hypothetical protein
MRRSWRGGSHGRWHCGSKDKARRGRADRVTNNGITRDIASDDTEPFGQRPFNDIDPVHEAIALGYTGATNAVEANSMDFVEIGQSTELRSQVADALDWCDITVH